jgi:hypothetical protein
MSYPEHEKMKAVHEESQAIGEFIEWLGWKKEIRFAKWIKESVTHEDIWGKNPPKTTEIDNFIQIELPIEQTLAEFFNIDLTKIKQEKRAMLDELRAANSRVVPKEGAKE